MSTDLDFVINTGKRDVCITGSINQGEDITFTKQDYLVLEELFPKELKRQSKRYKVEADVSDLQPTPVVYGLEVLHGLNAFDTYKKINRALCKIDKQIKEGLVWGDYDIVREKLILVMELCEMHPLCKIIIEGVE